MFNKIFDFFVDYEDLIKILLIISVFFISMCLITKHIDIDLSKEKNIIESTKQYYKYDECKNIKNTWYCWNKKED